MKAWSKVNFLASHSIFKILPLVREPKKLLFGDKKYPMLLTISNSTGLAPKTWEKLILMQNGTPYCTSKLIVCSFESSWQEKYTYMGYSQYSTANILKIQTKNKIAVIVDHFTVNILESIVNTAIWLVSSLFVPSETFEWACNELCTTI